MIPGNTSSTMDVPEAADIQASFEQNLLPILTSRCAYAGCHVADGPHGIDLRTYESFKAGGEDGPIFIPGNAANSDIIEEIVSERIPADGPSLSSSQIQLFTDWINQQEAIPGYPVHDDDDDHDHDDHDDHDDSEGDDHDDDTDDDHDNDDADYNDHDDDADYDADYDDHDDDADDDHDD